MIEATPDERWTWKSWVESANDSAIGFPLQSLPYCAFTASDSAVHLGVGIGNFVLDLHELAHAGHLSSLTAGTQSACRATQVNDLMRCGRAAWGALRETLIHLLRDDASVGQRRPLEPLLVPVDSATFHTPVAVGNYTDFYASIHHATNVGKLFRPDQPLLPNYKWLPVGYHGRASSIIIGDTAVRRPRGQTKSPAEFVPTFAPTAQLDYELEVAAYIGVGNSLGNPINLENAEQHIFGFSLLNDWSARDIQSWEYQPLGPFLGKSFATSVSPWVVPMEALLPFRVAPEACPTGDPEPLPYLRQSSSTPGAIDLTLEVFLGTARMRDASLPPIRVSIGNLRDLYWTFAQMVAHHTSNGCNLVAGDLLASGTVSGPEPGSQGCLLEITQRGARPLRLPNGDLRTFLEDGDEVILRGYCEKPGFPRISLGECRGMILPSS
jgi:fumarylacetoacetase